MLKAKITLTLAIIILITTACNAVTSTPVIAPPTVGVTNESLPTQPVTDITSTSAPLQSNIPQTEAEVLRVSLADAKQALDDQAAIFVDTRGRQAFEGSHIKGAFYIGDFQLDPTLSLDKNQWIITYCT